MQEHRASHEGLQANLIGESSIVEGYLLYTPELSHVHTSFVLRILYTFASRIIPAVFKSCRTDVSGDRYFYSQQETITNKKKRAEHCLFPVVIALQTPSVGFGRIQQI